MATYKWYYSKYKTPSENDSVAYIQDTVESIINDWTPISSTGINYTFLDDKLTLTTQIFNDDINYLKLITLTGPSRDEQPIFYFYKKDLLRVESYDKEGNMMLTYSFELDYYQTIFRIWFFYTLLPLNPKVYFKRKFGNRFALDSNGKLCIDFIKNWWLNKKVNINLELTRIETESFKHTNDYLLELNKFQNSTFFIDWTTKEIDLNKNITTVRWMDVAGGEYGTALAEVPKLINVSGNLFKLSGFISFRPYGGKNVTMVDMWKIFVDIDKEFTINFIPDTKKVLFYTATGSYVKECKLSIEGKRIVFEMAGDSWTNDVVINFSEDEAFILEYPLTSQKWINVPLDTFKKSNSNNKYKYILVKETALKSKSLLWGNNPFNIIVIPIFKEFQYQEDTGLIINVDEEKYLHALFDPIKSGVRTAQLVISESELIGAFEEPIDNILKFGTKGYFVTNYFQDTAESKVPIPYYLIDSNNNNSIKINSTPINEITRIVYEKDFVPEIWNIASEPILFNKQFFNLSIDNSINQYNLIPLDLFQIPIEGPLEFYLNINLSNKVEYYLHIGAVATPRADYTTLCNNFLFHFSNPINLTFTAYQNWLSNNMNTEATSFANLEDSRQVMNRNNVMLGIGAALAPFEAISDMFKKDKEGKLPNWQTDVGIGLKGAQTTANKAISIVNNKTNFGIKERNLQTEYNNLKSSSGSLSSINAYQYLRNTCDGLQFKIKCLWKDQAETVLAEIQNYGYLWDAVDNLATFDNRAIFNVIQLDVSYNFDYLNQLLITHDFTKVANVFRFRMAFFDWLGSIHRFYKTKDFNVEYSSNIENNMAISKTKIFPLSSTSSVASNNAIVEGDKIDAINGKYYPI